MGLRPTVRRDFFGVRFEMASKPSARACSQVLVCFLGAAGSVARSSISAP